MTCLATVAESVGLEGRARQPEARRAHSLNRQRAPIRQFDFDVQVEQAVVAPRRGGIGLDGQVACPQPLLEQQAGARQRRESGEDFGGIGRKPVWRFHAPTVRRRAAVVTGAA